ncbi:hypothetical protein HKX48_005926, partial [Thoreauomyces humboldtii]
MVNQSAWSKFRRELGKRTGRLKGSSAPCTTHHRPTPKKSAASPHVRIDTPRRGRTEEQIEYEEMILSDLELFAAHPVRDWKECPVSVGRNDGTWLSICRHFILRPGQPNAEVLVDRWVALDEDILAMYGVSKGSFLGYAANTRQSGSRLSWRQSCSFDQAHMTEMKDSAGYSRVKLVIHPRSRDWEE